jgi:uncharacterized protein YcfL
LDFCLRIAIFRPMKNIRLPLLIIAVYILVCSSCTQQPAVSGTNKILNAEEHQDSIRTDELRHPIDHQHLTLVQRALIRPIYVETEKNISVEHKGFQINALLKNTTSMVSYKNVVIEIDYVDKKGISLNKEKITVKRIIMPGDTVKISQKVLKYQNTSYKVKLLTADADLSN